MALILCPRCRHLLDQDDPQRQACTYCGGIFILREGIARLLEELRSASDHLTMLTSPYREAPHQIPTKPRTPRESELRYLRCPQCARHMNRITLAKGSGMVLDFCLLHGVWFDPHELDVAKKWVRATQAPAPSRLGDEDPVDQRDDEQREEIALTLKRFFSDRA